MFNLSTDQFRLTYQVANETVSKAFYRISKGGHTSLSVCTWKPKPSTWNKRGSTRKNCRRVLQTIFPWKYYLFILFKHHVHGTISKTNTFMKVVFRTCIFLLRIIEWNFCILLVIRSWWKIVLFSQSRYLSPGSSALK